MMRIGNRIGRPTNLPSSSRGEIINDNINIGIEWEVEGYRSPRNFDSSLLHTMNDGTLRGDGKEIIFKEPMSGGLAISAINNFYENINFHDLDCSELCSVHLHIDVRWASEKQAAAMAVLLAVVDLELYDITNSGNRIGNIYASSAYNNYGFWTQVRKLWKNRSIGSLNRRYSSINLMPVHGQGSIEVRHSNIIYDKKVLLDYINLVLDTISPIINNHSKEIKKSELVSMVKKLRRNQIASNVSKIIMEIL